MQFNKYTHTHTHNQREWHRMTRMTRPDCAVMCNLINTHTHTHTHKHRVLISRAKSSHGASFPSTAKHETHTEHNPKHIISTLCHPSKHIKTSLRVLYSIPKTPHRSPSGDPLRFTARQASLNGLARFSSTAILEAATPSSASLRASSDRASSGERTVAVECRDAVGHQAQ